MVDDNELLKIAKKRKSRDELTEEEKEENIIEW